MCYIGTGCIGKFGAMTRSTRIAIKVVFTLSCIVTIAYWFLATVYFGFVMAAAPLAPDPAHGLVFAHDNHGTVHYLSHFNYVLYGINRISIFIALPALAITGALGLIFNGRKPDTDE